MIVLRQKVFFEYGITSADIMSHAKANKLSANDAYNALKTQRANQGIGQEAFKAGDKSLFKANTIKATKDSAGVLGKSGGGQFGYNQYKQSATAASGANAKFNQAYNMGKASATTTAKTPGAASWGAKAGQWVGANKGKLALGALAVGGTIYAAKKLKDKNKEQ